MTPADLSDAAHALDPPLDATRALLARLVAFDSVSDRANRPLIDWAADRLRAAGADEVQVIGDADKAGLIARFGPAGPGAVVLSGHTDVVPTAAQVWSSDPFRLRGEGGRLYGRGTTDMKGFIACCLALAPRMAAAGLGRPIYFCFSHDEETTCAGVLPLIDRLAAELSPGAVALVGEPTDNKPIAQHKGAYGWEFAVRGVPAHSSQPALGASAVEIAARLVAWIADRQAAWAAAAGPGPFQPNHTTSHVGRISGGEAVNILAQACRFDWELRTMPGERAADHRAAFEAEAARIVSAQPVPGASVTLREDYAVPPLAAEPDGAAERLARRLTGANEAAAGAYSTEAGWFQQAGLSTVLCGPGSVAQAHIADEFIEEAALARCLDWLGRLIDHQSAG